MTAFDPLAAAASVPPVAEARLASLFPGWSATELVVALGVAGVALVFLAGVLAADVVRTWKGRR